MLFGHAAILISGFSISLPLFSSPVLLVSSMDLRVIHCSDLSNSAALGICMVRVADVYTISQDISYPFDPGSEGGDGFGWMQ